MGRILIVEDDSIFAEALGSAIEGEGHTVVVAENGKAAIAQLEKQSFDCVISDFQMPVMTGAELAVWLRQNQKNIPLIMMTGFADSMDTAKAIASGASNIIYKPFNGDELIHTLGAILGDPVTNSTIEIKYCRVPSFVFSGGGRSDVNIYCEDGGKYSKIVSRQENLDEKLEILKKAKHVFVEAVDLSKLLPTSLMFAKATALSGMIKEDKRTEVIKDTIAIIYDHVGHLGLDADLLSNSVEVITSLVSNINDTTIWSMLEQMHEDENLLYAKTLLSSTIAMLIAQKRDYDTALKFKLAMICLYHDIGELQLEPTLLKTPPIMRNSLERLDYQKHVEFGVRMLRETKVVPEDICEIIMQHHEDTLGHGYPLQLKGEQIHILARILHAVDDLVLAMIKTKSLPGQDPLKALSKLKENQGLDQKVIEDLLTIFSTKKERRSA